MMGNDESENEIFVNADDGLDFEALDEANTYRRRLKLQLLAENIEGINLDEIFDDEDFPTSLSKLRTGGLFSF